MAQIRYIIRRLSIQNMLSYAKRNENGRYCFELTPAQTKAVVSGKGETLQDDNAIFFQIMCLLHGDNYVQPDEDTIIHDLEDVILYFDFSGIFDRDENNPKVQLMQKKTEALFYPDGITLDFGHGKMKYIAFERSGSMSRECKLSFVRADIYEKLKERMTVGMKLGTCQLSKLHAYNGLLFSSGTRIETNMLWGKDAIVVIDNPTAVYSDIDVITVEDTTGEGNVRKYDRVERKTDVKVELFDGEGVVSSEFADEIDGIYCGQHIHSSFQIRMPYIKGMLHKVNFRQLFKEADVKTITDMWGEEHPIENICIILTKSQFKGHGWMKENGLAFSEYLNRLQQYRHTLYITGVNKINTNRNTEINYQYLSTLTLNSDQFRPKDMPFDWRQNVSVGSWLTKNTEETYFRLLNDKWFQYDYYIYSTPQNPSSRRYRLSEMLRRNDLLLAEKVYRGELEKEADNLLQKFAKGNILVEGRAAYLSSDLTLFFAELLKPHIQNNKCAEKVYCELMNARAVSTSAYIPNIRGTAALLRNPHIAKNEEAVVTIPSPNTDIRTRYFSHLIGVVMIEPQSLIAERLGGADYDGDMIKVITEPVICESVASHYKEVPNYEDRFANKYNLPLLHIPAAEPQIRDADDCQARFEAVKSTFSSRVGQISNTALDRSTLAYDESIDNEIREQNRKETETLAILTGLEIDSVKSGIKPDLSEYLGKKKTNRSLYLKYKKLLDNAESRPAWYEETFEKKMKAYIDSCDWESVSANVEKLPYYAYMLKKCNPKQVPAPAPSNEIFTFAKHENWKEQLDKSLFQPIENLIDTYDRCLRRIRSFSHPVPGNSKSNDIYRIFATRDQENIYTTEELYALFTDVDTARIKIIYDAIKEEKWHFMPPDKRIEFLMEYLPEEDYREYDNLFADFRMGGYRILGDIICDKYDERCRTDKNRLYRKNDSDEMKTMLKSYLDREIGTDYREAVSNACREVMAKIAPGFQVIRYAEALGRRDFIFDVLLEEAEFYLIGGGNE